MTKSYERRFVSTDDESFSSSRDSHHHHYHHYKKYYGSRDGDLPLTDDIQSNDLRTLLQKLVPKVDTQIDALAGADRENFQEVITIIDLVGDTNPKVFQVLEEVIGGAVATVKPGTVGARLVGCSRAMAQNPAEASCHAICAGSFVPNREGTNWKECQSTVYYLKDGHLQELSFREGSPNVILWVEKGTSPQLSQVQVDFITKQGGQVAQVKGLDSVSGASQDLGTQPVAQLTKVLTSTTTTTAPATSNFLQGFSITKPGTSWILWILIIILIIVLVYYGSKWFGKK